MKRMKKLLAVMLAALMVVSMGGMSVMAETATEGAYTITLTGTTGHTYKAYQIFSGDYSSEELTNIKWGENIDTSKVATIISAMTASESVFGSYLGEYLTSSTEYSSSNDTSAAAVAKVLANGIQNDSEAITAFAVLVKAALNSEEGTELTEDPSGTYTCDVSTVGAGYYLVVDETTGTLAEGDAISAYILKVVGQAVAEAKVDVPQLTKTIEDSDLQENTEQSTAGLNDTVSYKLTSTVPDTSDYTTYTFKIKDTLSKGLEYQSDTLVVRVGTETLTKVDAADNSTKSYTVAVSGSSSGEEGTVITIELVNFIASNYTKGATIEITYGAKLTADATVGNTGNTNTATLEYSNNPYGEGTGKTTETYVTTYTTSLSVTKIDGDLQAYISDLEGISFTLTDGEDYSKTLTIGKDDGNDDGNDGILTFTDLAAGTYTLSENVGSTGYSAVNNITIVLKYNDSTDKWEVGDGSSEDLNVSDGVFGITIENNQGSTIPTTGGIGTTIFYVTGAILVLGAAVILITRRRMGNRA